jgi:hypothetical protein
MNKASSLRRIPSERVPTFGTVRINGIVIHNFRGIRRAEVGDLGSEQLVTVSGRNGSGKSLILEAIGLLWRVDRLQSGLHPQLWIGGWGNQLTIEMELSFTDEERRELEHARTAYAPGLTGAAPATASMGLEYRAETGANVFADPWLQQLLRTPQFAAEHSFGQIDHLPADRTTGRGEQAQVNPSLLSEQQREQLRASVVGSYAQQRQVVGISGVAPLLATADYMDLLAERQELEPSGDFDAITNPFYDATGKRVRRPSIDPNDPYGAGIRVETPAGMEHGLDQLSSGEQEVLSLSFFVRRLRARGGVLLIDEPELHLHPALQRSLFAQLEDVAARAQVWIVTHSPSLVTTASLSAVLHMREPSTTDANQLIRASDERDRLEVLEDLGIHPIELLQNEFIVAVEGTTDQQRLSALLPLELAAAVVTIGGNAEGVESVARNLASTGTIPFLAVRDRDLLDDEQKARRENETPGLFIWPGRALENELLYPDLVVQALGRAGQEESVSSIRERLEELAQRQRSEIVADLAEQALDDRFQLNPSGGDRLSRLRSYIAEQGRASREKEQAFDSVREEVESRLDREWPDRWPQLMDGKRALGELVQFTPFQSSSGLVGVLLATGRDHPELLSPGMQRLRAALRELAVASRDDTSHN